MIRGTPSGKVWPLMDNQRLAADPGQSVWLSASAGTGKTQVLSARVLRLLLEEHVRPSQILCLTFTKAGAAEMAVRINEVLASWVRLSETALASDLMALGASSGPHTRARARTLFAEVLDCPGGGLRIDTIHAFSQWLLAAFPAEAGLGPGTRAMEDRDRVLLVREVLGDLLLDAEIHGRDDLLTALVLLSERLGPDAVPDYLLRCAQARDAWEGPGAWLPPFRSRVEQLLGLPVGANQEWLEELCGDDRFAVADLRRCMEINAAWKAKTGQAAAAEIGEWLSSTPPVRLATLDGLGKIFIKTDGERKSSSSQDRIDPAYADHATSIITNIKALREIQVLLELADFLEPAFTLGHAFAQAWEAAKQREGLIDFDDQIRHAANLLRESDQAEWIRYKLDRRFDHVLVDEAQDTNAAQWDIIFALTGDFFAGLGAHADKLRTIFVVGDYKQAIFRFQGTSPENFEAARRRFRTEMEQAATNAEGLRANLPVHRLAELGLGWSYRTSSELLGFVDRAIGEVGHQALGLDQPADPHAGDSARPGHVAFWRPVGLTVDDGSDLEDESGEGAESWLSKPDRLLADRIARQVREWMDNGFPLYKGGSRRAGPGDVMVLVRKRRELAGLIVARLHAAGVPVAGVDRLRLGAPLAVRDLLSALRFSAQPLDDLNLACLLVSPLIGWSQEQLLEHGWRPRGEYLWLALRRSRHGDVVRTVDRLVDLLNRADNELPQSLLHWLLTGPWDGRRRLVARLGREAHDPIDELLNAAHAHAVSHVSSLIGFLNWFDAGEGELKREASREGGMVRVMTVHGAKGLQAPIVILADAAGNPKSSRPVGIDLPDIHDAARKLPLPPLGKSERVGRIAEEAKRSAIADMQEHWRLFYVAMTRAEEALFVTGSLTSKEKAPSADSWFARLEKVFSPGEWIHDDLWGARLEWGTPPDRIPSDLLDAPIVLPVAPALPSWLEAPLVVEPRPPRPLAPSSLGEDMGAEPPWPAGTGQAAAARRGTLLHKLLERLPEIGAHDRYDAALIWLERNAPDLDQAVHAEIVDSVLAVIGNPDWMDIFGPGSLAEVPIAALVGDRVVAGTIDRLLIDGERLRLIDFKSSRRVPDGASGVPAGIMRQMAAYVAALETAYPGKVVEAALLYTQAPLLIELPAESLAMHKQALVGQQDSL